MENADGSQLHQVPSCGQVLTFHSLGFSWQPDALARRNGNTDSLAYASGYQKYASGYKKCALHKSQARKSENGCLLKKDATRAGGILIVLFDR